MRYVRLAVFSLVLLTTTAVSLISNGGNAGLTRECLGIKVEASHQLIGALKSTYEILSVNHKCLAAAESGTGHALARHVL